MSVRLLSILMVVFGLLACGEEGTDPVEQGPEFPLELVVPAETALVIPTGEIIDHPDFKSGDLVFYASSPVNISSGCPEMITKCMPIRICRPSSFSKPEVFTGIDQVCADLPEENSGDGTMITNATEGSGFVVRLNSDEGYARVWIKKIEGTGRGANLTLVVDLVE